VLALTNSLSVIGAIKRRLVDPNSTPGKAKTPPRWGGGVSNHRNYRRSARQGLAAVPVVLGLFVAA
jgi:hypothetical protein